LILVFGRTGQVATELQAFKDVKALGRKEADLSDLQACADAIQFYKPQAVINAAAYTSVDQADREQDLANTINGEAPAVIAEACNKLHIPMIHISTDYVFDGTGTQPWSVSDAPNPLNVYGRSKLVGEEAVRSSSSIYAILRTSWVFSAHGNNFVKTMLRLSETREQLTVVDDQIGGPTCARDIALTCVSIAEQLAEKPNKSGIYHYSGQPEVSWCQFANTIFEKAGRLTIANPISTSDFPTLAKRPSNSRLDCSSIKDVYGIPRPLWRESLDQVLLEIETRA
jgi:dTDP-4-dehydrorhamnose reductase